MKNTQNTLIRLHFGAPGSTDSKLGVQNLTALNTLIAENTDAYQTNDVVWSVDEKAFYTIDMTTPASPVFTVHSGGGSGDVTFYYGQESDIKAFLEGDTAFKPSTVGYSDGDGILCSAPLVIAGNPDIAALDLFEVTGGGEFYTWKASLSGTAGVGVPAGGVTGHHLVKSSNDDFDSEWVAETLQKVCNGGAVTTTTMTATDFILSSDRRLKKDIKELEVKHIPIKFRTFLMAGQSTRQVGVIADELQKTNPEFVINEKENGFLAVKYTSLLMAKIAELEQRIKELEK